MSMPTTYAYKGRDAAGKLVKGKVEASSESAVVSRLRTMGLSPIEITESVGGSGLQTELNLGFLEKGVGLKDLAVMSRQLATMVSSGHSLLRALTILAGQTENKKLARALTAIRGQVETGSALSEAFARQGTMFPPIMIHLVRAGEVGGFLDQSLESIAKMFEADVKLRQTIKSALTYPVVVLVMDRKDLPRDQRLAQRLRQSGIAAEMYLGTSGMKAQMKYADRRGSPCVVIQGGDEIAKGEVQIKDLIEGSRLSATISDAKEWREGRPAQFSVPEAELVAAVQSVLARHQST